MIIEFVSSKLKKQCETKKMATKAWGGDAPKRLIKRLGQIQASDNLEVFRLIAPATNPHPLKGKRRGQWAITIHKGLRLIFKPNHIVDDYTKEDGGIDWKKITEIMILEIKDYHDEKH